VSLRKIQKERESGRHTEKERKRQTDKERKRQTDKEGKELDRQGQCQWRSK
jgi:hypothetical protein